ncbi:MAG: propionyl-CoA synthetase [Saprospiraceae bacterium]|nr:propionyl-CoA synthetase [Saprospiraceae bacterium]
MNYQDFYNESIDQPAAFWEKQAQKLDWFSFPEEVLYKDEHDLYRWFKGGTMNTCYLALDYHVENGRGDQVAIIYDSPVTNQIQKFTYKELLEKVSLFAGVLKAKGVQKGDTIVIYMPMIPETVIAMLACARLGAIHSVVFGGFAAHELAIRIDDARPKLLLTASGGLEITRIIDYMDIVNRAIEEATHQIEACIVFQRDFLEAPLKEGRDFDWVSLTQNAKPASYVPLEASAPLYILYTSGTTGKPKGIVRENGGHAVAMKFSMDYVYGIQAGEVYWAASDVGWVVGHSYIVYAPLIQGCTSILFEGKPIKTPDAGTFWRIIQEHQVNVFFTAPTAFRAIKKEDPNSEYLKQYQLSTLRTIFLAGERCDVSTLNWLSDTLGIPIIDHWWQTESGSPMISNLAGMELIPIKPGSAGKAVPGYNICILGEDMQELGANEEGAVAIQLPLAPGCLPNLWQDTARFKESYLSPFPGYYFSGDGGYKDEDGYIFITGRIDDIINVAGHRLSTAEMEEVVASHTAVAECAVIGINDPLKGQIPVGFVVLKSGMTCTEVELEKELISMVRDQVGPVASFKRAVVCNRLPKTRSGKILRKIMRNIADKVSYTPPSTIEDMSVLGELETLMLEKHIGA